MKAWVAAAAALAAGISCRPASPPMEDAETAAGSWAEVRFVDLAEEAGVRFRHYPAESGKFYMPEIMGAGVALLDFDNDGDLDLFLLQGKPLDPGLHLPVGVTLGNRLYRNELYPVGQFRFTDVTSGSGLGAVMYGMGAATGDYDNDGYTDLYVTSFGSNHLYHNNGNGTFTDVTTRAGVDDERWSTSAAFADYDRDGDLDLMVLNYVDFTVAGNKNCQAPSGEPDFCTPKAYRPVTARLFRNEGGGRFTDVTIPSGIGRAYGPGLGVTCADVNGDGWLDFYVANDTAANLLWINQRDGTFLEEGLPRGAAYSEDGLAKAGMGVAAGDYDNDGDEDLFVVNLTREGATLFANDGKGNFTDVSLRTGLRPATFSYTGFGTDWFDFDHDGWLDLFIANGAVTLMESLRGRAWPFNQKNNLLRAVDGTRFEEIGMRAGLGMVYSEVSRGAAFGDLDNDGDLDIALTNNNGPARLLMNSSRRKGGWVQVQLEGVKANRMGLGARVGVGRKDAPVLWRRCHTDSSYLSASDARVHVGLGRAAMEGIRVEWPDGTRESFPHTAANRVIRIRQGTGTKE